jgi:putative addiction module component (TIGR02574 family)
MNASEIQQGALSLPQDQRALLIAELMDSLPAVLSDVDDGSIEAKRRLAELKLDPSTGKTWDEVKSSLGR